MRQLLIIAAFVGITTTPALAQDMGVDHGRGHVIMPQKLLHGADEEFLDLGLRPLQVSPRMHAMEPNVAPNPVAIASFCAD